MKKFIGIIGCGNMGRVILERNLKVDRAKNFIIFEKDKLRQAFIIREFRSCVKTATDIVDLIRKADVVIIAVKPQDIDIVLGEIQRGMIRWRKKNLLIISIAAGIETKYIEDKISGEVKVVRAMPNMPAQIGKGITALKKGRFTTSGDLKTAKNIFASLGDTFEVSKEMYIDVVTALSGSGPAYICFIFASMLAAAEAMGLDKKESNRLIYQTIIGSMDLLKEKKFDTKGLISNVASKGGTTEAALKVFKEKKLEKIIIEAIMAAYNRAKKLSR